MAPVRRSRGVQTLAPGAAADGAAALALALTVFAPVVLAAAVLAARASTRTAHSDRKASAMLSELESSWVRAVLNSSERLHSAHCTQLPAVLPCTAMTRITLELLRRRSEHNDKELSTLKEITLHQFEIRQIEVRPVPWRQACARTRSRRFRACDLSSLSTMYAAS